MSKSQSELERYQEHFKARTGLESSTKVLPINEHSLSQKDFDLKDPNMKQMLKSVSSKEVSKAQHLGELKEPSEVKEDETYLEVKEPSVGTSIPNSQSTFPAKNVVQSQNTAIMFGKVIKVDDLPESILQFTDRDNFKEKEKKETDFNTVNLVAE